jgi:hypothetical protein
MLQNIFELKIRKLGIPYQPTTVKDFFGKNLSTECTIQSSTSFGNKFPTCNVPCPLVKRFLWKKNPSSIICMKGKFDA